MSDGEQSIWDIPAEDSLYGWYLFGYVDATIAVPAEDGGAPLPRALIAYALGQDDSAEGYPLRRVEAVMQTCSQLQAEVSR